MQKIWEQVTEMTENPTCVPARRVKLWLMNSEQPRAMKINNQKKKKTARMFSVWISGECPVSRLKKGKKINQRA